MSYTARDVAIHALSELRVTPGNEEPSAEDLALVLAIYNSVYARLLRRYGLAFDQDIVPDEALLPLARLVAAEAAPRFDGRYDPDAVRAFENALRASVAPRPTYQTVPVEYF